MEACIRSYAGYLVQPGVAYCNATYDGYVCWPPTEAGHIVEHKCPKDRFSDTNATGYRLCGEDGSWLGQPGDMTQGKGWSNYTPCFPIEVQNLLKLVGGNPKMMLRVAYNTRNMEIVGFTVSLLALLVSLLVFFYFRGLRNIRTKIHTNLFMAMVLQVIVRLILYLDQLISRPRLGEDPTVTGGLDSLPYICEGFYILLEYGISAMFCWMFIEGLYLHSIVTDYALRERVSYKVYLLLGWGGPIALTSFWTMATAIHYSKASIQHCWYGYNFLGEYWVNQGIRLLIILMNMGFLVNIMRVIIIKLRRSMDSELQRAKKAARAALVLLPLLGITNILNMVQAPLDGQEWKFALWSYTTHFLRSFQGLFIALIYCFFNAEVREQVIKLYRDLRAQRSLRQTSYRSRARARAARESSPLGPLELVQDAFNNERAGMELTDFYLRRMYIDPEVLDNLDTIQGGEVPDFTGSA